MAPMQPDNLRQTAAAIREVRCGKSRDYLGQHHIECCAEAADELDSLRTEVSHLRECRDLLAKLSGLETYRETVGEDDLYRTRRRELLTAMNAVFPELAPATAQGAVVPPAQEDLLDMGDGRPAMARCDSAALHQWMTLPFDAVARLHR